jgi:hypothetical protein
VSFPFTLPAPSRGLNTRDAVADLRRGFAIELDNLFPIGAGIRLRGGSTQWATGFASNLESLHVYSSGTTERMFAFCANHLYEVTTSGAVGSSLLTLTNGRFVSVNQATPAGNFLIAASGYEEPVLFNGTSWVAYDTTTAGSSFVFSGDLDKLAYPVLYQQRLWFLERGTLTLWYTENADTISGNLDAFPVGSFFNRGGSLAALGTWTLDAGNGPEDYLAVVTTEGEVGIWAGIDPSSSTTFRLVGIYFVGKPVGFRPLEKVAGDLVLLTNRGAFPLSVALQTAEARNDPAVSDVVYPTITALAEQDTVYPHMTLFTKKNALLVNFPPGVGFSSRSLVMNTETKAWCSFSGWDVTTSVIFTDRLFFGSGAEMYVGWEGLSDGANAITGVCVWAPDRLGRASTKKVQLVKPLLEADATVTVRVGVDEDFELSSWSTSKILNLVGASTWDSATWSTSVWAASAAVRRPWMKPTSRVCSRAAMRLQVETTTANVLVTAMDLICEPASVFYL